jgi:hypothetical protein
MFGIVCLMKRGEIIALTLIIWKYMLKLTSYPQPIVDPIK